MKPLDYLIIALIAVWFLLALRSIWKRRGGCGCSGGSSCQGKNASCTSCASCRSKSASGASCASCHGKSASHASCASGQDKPN